MSWTDIPEVLVNGAPADLTEVTVYSDTSTSLSIPPSQGSIAGAEAEFEWEYPQDASTEVETPWQGSFRPNPGADVEVHLPSSLGGPRFLAFKGQLDSSRVTFGSPIRSRSTDPLTNVNATFSCPPLTSTMPIAENTVGTVANRRHVGALGVYQVERALNAIGVRNTVPQSSTAVAHHSVCGSLWPQVGRLAVGQEADGIGPAVPPAPVGSYGPTFASTVDGRVICLSGWLITYLANYSTGSGTDSMTVAVELHPGEPADYQVRVTGTGEAGIRVRVQSGAVNIQTIDGTGALLETLDTFLIGSATRLLVRNTEGGDITAMTDATGATKRTYVGKGVAALSARFGGRLIVGGTRFGAVSVYRNRADVDADNFLNHPRRVKIWLSPINDEQWRIHGHPPIVDEPAVQWLARRAQDEQGLLWVDHEGAVNWMEIRGLDDLPVSGNITDADYDGTIPLESLSHITARRDTYSRVRVKATRSGASYSYNEQPHLVACRAPEKVELRRGDDPVELWMHAEGSGWWYGRPSSQMRRAGEPATEPWHRVDDFERHRGSWYGGHVINADGDILRWANEGDVTISLQLVGDHAVKLIIGPGPALVAGEVFINLPRPNSPGLQDVPDLMNLPLPMLTAWAVVPEALPIEAVSSDIGPDTAPEYIHDAGWSASFLSGPRAAGALAADIAARHTDHVGEVTVSCPVAPVRIGQRWQVEVRTVSGFVMDAVVLGVPRMTMAAGVNRMELRLWVMAVRPLGQDAYAPAFAGLAYAGLSYAGL